MASEGPTCSICFECYDSQNHCPRMLPSCGHSFCSRCVEMLRNEDSITCPTCKRTCTVPMPAGVGDLPKNFELLRLLDTKDATPQHAENKVSPICEEIGALVTKANSHIMKIKAAEERVLSVLFKMHKDRESWMTFIQDWFKLELQVILTAREQILMKELEQFYETNTRVDMSPGFARLPSNFAFLSIKNARDHKCLLRAEAVSKCLHEMKALATNASTDAEEIKAAKGRVVDALILGLQKACGEMACETRSLFIKLRDELTVREDVLINELNNLYISKQSILLDQLECLYMIQVSLKSTFSEPVMPNIQSLSHPVLLDVKSNLKSTLEDIETQLEDIVFEPEAECVLEVTFNEQLVLWSLHNLDGNSLVCVIKNMGAVSDKSTCAATTSAAGFGLQCAPLGNEASFTIVAYDAQGLRREVGSDVFVVELKEKTGEGKVEVNLENNGDGTYLATYTVPADAEPGDYALSVFLRGTHIHDSPFVVRVGHPY